MIRIGIIGYGYWGPNIVRNVARIQEASISWVCDLNPAVLSDAPRLYPNIRITQKTDDIFSDPDTDAVIIATPVTTHFPLAYQALESGKHVLVEKPMTSTLSQAKKLNALAKTQKKILMVDHTFIYTPAVRAIKELIDSNELGDIYYVDSVRTNLGLFQKDVNVVYDLATHDFAIMEYLLGSYPTKVTATGVMQPQIQQETVAHITAQFPKNVFFHSHVSWLSPVKIRTMIFVGTKKMLVYDDMEPSEKIKIYDKGVSVVKNPKQKYQLRIGYRTGSAVVPNIGIEEGLYGVISEYISAIRTNRPPITDGQNGQNVVKTIEAITASLRANSKYISL